MSEFIDVFRQNLYVQVKRFEFHCLCYFLLIVIFIRADQNARTKREWKKSYHGNVEVFNKNVNIRDDPSMVDNQNCKNNWQLANSMSIATIVDKNCIAAYKRWQMIVRKRIKKHLNPNFHIVSTVNWTVLVPVKWLTCWKNRQQKREKKYCHVVYLWKEGKSVELWLRQKYLAMFQCYKNQALLWQRNQIKFINTRGYAVVNRP